MSMTFRQLEVFDVVYRTGSFAAAANQLDVSQASVSKQIRALEQHLGIELFSRKRGAKAELSQQASHVPQLVNQLLSLAEKLPPEAQKTRVVRVACGDVMAELITQALPGFMRSEPNIEIELIIKEPTLDTVGEAWQQQLDLACFTLVQPPPLPDATLVKTVRTGIFVKAGSELDRNWLDDDGTSLPVIFPLQRSSLERSFTQTLQKSGIPRWHIAMRLQSYQARTEMVLRGAGAILSFYDKHAKELQEGNLVALDLPDKNLYRYVFVNPKVRLTPALTTAINFIKSSL